MKLPSADLIEAFKNDLDRRAKMSLKYPGHARSEWDDLERYGRYLGSGDQGRRARVIEELKRAGPDGLRRARLIALARLSQTVSGDILSDLEADGQIQRQKDGAKVIYRLAPNWSPELDANNP